MESSAQNCPLSTQTSPTRPQAEATGADHIPCPLPSLCFPALLSLTHLVLQNYVTSCIELVLMEIHLRRKDQQFREMGIQQESLSRKGTYVL